MRRSRRFKILKRAISATPNNPKKPYLCKKNAAMHTAIKMPLRSLNLAVVKDLQEKYPNAEVSVVVNHDPNQAPLSEQRFWEIIAMLDWSKQGDDAAVIEPAVALLAASPVRHIYEFEDILSEKLYLLDGLAYARQTGTSAYQSEDDFFSVDGFLYDRCCVVANGRELYEAVLNDPTKMPKDMSFGALLRVAHEAYQRKTGKKFEYLPAYNYETYSNEEGWK